MDTTNAVRGVAGHHLIEAQGGEFPASSHRSVLRVAGHLGTEQPYPTLPASSGPSVRVAGQPRCDTQSQLPPPRINTARNEHPDTEQLGANTPMTLRACSPHARCQDDPGTAACFSSGTNASSNPPKGVSHAGTLDREDLLDWIREIMADRECTAEEAATQAVAGLEHLDPAVFEAFLYEVVAPYLAHEARFFPVPPTTAQWRSGETSQGISWLVRMAQEMDMWDLLVPVSGTPLIKRLGEFTAHDVCCVEDYYKGRTQAMRVVAETWGRVRRAMKDTDTLESASSAGRIGRHLVRAIGQQMFGDV